MTKPKNKLYIDYRNKDKKFKQDRIYFTGDDYMETYEKAVTWAKENFESYHPDMIKVLYIDFN